MEKSPAYFVESDVPERVLEMNETIKLLLVLRDPIDRTMSDYLQIMDNKVHLIILHTIVSLDDCDSSELSLYICLSVFLSVSGCLSRYYGLYLGNYGSDFFDFHDFYL